MNELMPEGAAEAAPDVALREDVKLLGQLLGEVLEALEGRSFYAHVEFVRQATQALRKGEPNAEAQLSRLLDGMPASEAERLAGAFSAWFGLVNLAERIHRVREHRTRGLRGGMRGSSTFESALSGTDQPVDAARAAALLGDITFEPVFTAHPTETTRRTLLIKEQRIADLLLQRIASGRDAHDERASVERLREEISIAWQTNEHFDQPSVADEVEHVLFFVQRVLYPVLPSLQRELDNAWHDVLGGARPSTARWPRPMVRFGSWVGGDMDGNPSVGASTIRHTLARQQEVLLGEYRAEIAALFDRLSHASEFVPADAPLRARIDAYSRTLPEALAGISPRYHDMPYRVFLWLCWSRLGENERGTQHGYASAAELLEDLELLDDALVRHGGAGRAGVRDLALRVRTFGLHLATLDVRQDSAVHREAVGDLLGVEDFAARPARARADALREALGRGGLAELADAVTAPAARDDAPPPALPRSLDCLRTMAECRRRHGADAFGLYIISMAEGADDVLAVLCLARAAGLVDEAGAVPLDVTPLFETVDDLEAAAGVMRELWADADYLRHVEVRERRQYVMLGYSDSNKQAGLAASRSALYVAQEQLIAAADDAGVELRLFHGRGGTISRGGGRPRFGIMAEPPGAVNGRLRVTEQGEIIAQKYGLAEIALLTMETSLAALIERGVGAARPPAVRPEWRAAMETLSVASRAAYSSLVGDPGFIRYFRAATPIDVIERMRIGSRPPARRAARGVQDLRAIPWVFAWTQSRHNLTGWYGLGTGLAEVRRRHGADVMRDMASGWRFFANLLEDAEMVMAKADLTIASRYAALAGDAGETWFATLREEFERTRTESAVARGPAAAARGLLSDDPRLASSLRLRDPYIDPLSLLQVDLLRRWRAGGREDAGLEQALKATVRGVARGMQNTG